MKRQLPKNVRQIGNVSDSSKIYIEDYVDTFFNQLCERAEQEMAGAFLIGETVHEEEMDYIYVYGAIRMQGLSVKGKELIIGDHVWKNACETCKEFFGNAEILGWFITGGELPLEVNHNMNKIHQKYFSRDKTIFVTKSTRDKEEKFYIYKYRDMMECGGHYIYYEKNIEMQNYMIETRKKVGFTPSEIIEDRVAKNFRSIIREKNEKMEQKNHSRLVYGVSTFLVLVIVAIGVTMLNNYDKMQDAQNAIDVFGENVVSEHEDEMQLEMETDEPDLQDVTAEEPQGEDAPTEEPQVETTQPDDSESSTTQSDEGQVQETPSEETILTPPRTYVVKKGDTLESISRKNYGDVAHVEGICELNNLNDGNLIFIGQKLLLP